MQHIITTRKIIFLLLLTLLFAIPVQAALENSYVLDDFSDTICTIPAPDIVKQKVVDSNLILSFDCTQSKQRFVHIPIQHDCNDQKIRITFSEINNHILGMGKFETTHSGEPIRSSFENNYLVYHKNPVEFSLQNKHYDALSFYFICQKSLPGTTGEVQIEKIEIVPKTFADTKGFAYIFAEIILFLFILPGFLTYSLLLGKGKKENLLALLTPLSIFFFLFLYLVLFVNQTVSSLPDTWVLLICYLAFNVLLFVWLKQKNELGILIANFRLVNREMFAISIVMLVVTAIIIYNQELPLHTFTYNQLKFLTYGVFAAHDPALHYVNGIAILHEEPFSKYYQHARLIYGVQDRGIIAGVIYAVIRGIGNPINSAIANSSGFYTLFGSALNILFLLPVLALHKYFSKDKERPFLIVFLISASAFILTNYYITWFKLAGAGLVISGIVLLLIDKKNIKQWLFTGIVWGLATNFHPSLALTYPIVTLWLLYRFFKAREYQFAPAIIAFTVLIGSFAVMNAPWTIIKSKYYPDTNTLFRQHFLDSVQYNPDTGIVGSFKSFTDKYTVKEQIEQRTERVIKSLRYERITSLLDKAATEKWQNTLKSWNYLEAGFIVFIFIPLILLSVLSSIATRLFPATAWDASLTRHNSEARALLITQALTVFLIIFGSFGYLAPDINWHIPMSCTAILMYVIIQKVITSGKIGAALIIGYSLFTYFRLFYQFF